MSTYRDDLEAALHRNHYLERRVAELERPDPLQSESPSGDDPFAALAAPAPHRAQAPARAATRSVVYAAPATYLPLFRMFAKYVAVEWRGATTMARWPRPHYESDVIVLDLLVRALVVAWLPVAFMLRAIWRTMKLAWFAATMPMVALVTLLVTPLAVPLIAALSVRRERQGKPLVGLEWGVSPTEEDTALYGLGALSIGLCVCLPIFLMIIVWA